MAETHAVLNVPTVSCNHCKMAIENAVGAIGGVGQVDVDVAEKTVTIDFDADAVTLESIEKTVADEGYEVAGRHVFGA
jgi:copper chaperone